MNSVECLATPVATTTTTSHHEPYSNQSRTVTGVQTTHHFHHHPGFPIGPGFPTPNLSSNLVPSTDSSLHHHPNLVRHPTAQHNVS